MLIVVRRCLWPTPLQRDGKEGGLGGTASRSMISRGALPGADFNVQGGDIYNGAPALLFINPNTLPTWGI